MVTSPELTFNEKREVLKVVAPALFQPCFGLNRFRIQDEINENREKYHELMYKLAADLYEKLIESQEKDGKGSLRYISIFYLKSSVWTGTNSLFIQAFTDELYFDPVEVSLDFPISFIFAYLDEDMQYGEKLMKKKIPGIDNALIKEIRHEYAGNYLVAAQKFMEYFSYVFAEHPLFAKVVKDDVVQVTFGGYYEQGIVIKEI